jgi:hypothetical protein
MTEQYVEVVKIHNGIVHLSNGDILSYINFSKCWCVEYKKSKYSERLIKIGDSVSCTTFKEAIASYEYRTGNCLVGPMDAEGVQCILDRPGLNWVDIKPFLNKETV